VPPAILAPLLILTPVAGSIERVGRRLAPVDRPELVQGREELAPVPGLDGRRDCDWGRGGEIIILSSNKTH
jgi:hypothetical protein